MEVAASLVGKAAQLQVVEREERPYQLTLGGQVGTVAMKVGKGKQSHSSQGCSPGAAPHRPILVAKFRRESLDVLLEKHL